MKKITIVFLWLGMLGCIFLILKFSVWPLIILDQRLPINDVESTNAVTQNIQMDESDSSIYVISYSYLVNGIVQKRLFKVAKTALVNKSILNKKLEIKYNSMFPKISFIDGVKHTQGVARRSFVLYFTFFLFFFLIYKFGNLNKSVKNYEELGNRPWLYPVDQNEKNPFRRFMGRFFRKQSR